MGVDNNKCKNIDDKCDFDHSIEDWFTQSL
jgi:hypothetical protein